MTNNALGNRVIGHEHGMWTRNTGNGKGAASGKICTQHAPFLQIEGNVFHDCQRFGMYPDNQHPRDLVRDEDGYVRLVYESSLKFVTSKLILAIGHLVIISKKMDLIMATQVLLEIILIGM